jgi:hypothetical protein
MRDRDIVVLFLGAALLLALAGIIGLAAFQVPVPDILANLALIDAGALTALLRPGQALTRPPAGPATPEAPPAD